jgi:hypothetical protein
MHTHHPEAVKSQTATAVELRIKPENDQRLAALQAIANTAGISLTESPKGYTLKRMAPGGKPQIHLFSNLDKAEIILRSMGAML